MKHLYIIIPFTAEVKHLLVEVSDDGMISKINDEVLLDEIPIEDYGNYILSEDEIENPFEEWVLKF